MCANVQACRAVNARVSVDVKATDLGVPIEVTLMPAEDAEVVVDVVIAASIVIVQAATISRVVGDDEIVVDFIPCWDG